MPWIDLDDVLDHLNKSDGADDLELEGFITAACAMIEDIKGHVDLVEVVEDLPSIPLMRAHNPHGGYGGYQYWEHVLLLTQPPVSSITSVAFLPGDGTTSTITAQNLATGVIYGWRREDTILHVPLATYRFGAFRVTYQAGLTPVPGNYRMAALELVAHLWRTTQLNASQGRPQMGEMDQEYIRGMSYAMPFRVRELLGIYGGSVGSAATLA